MILSHLKIPGREAAGVKLFSGSVAVFQHPVGAAHCMEGGWYAV